MAKKKATARKKRRTRKVARRKPVRRSKKRGGTNSKARRSSSGASLSYHKKKIRDIAKQRLKDGLYQRDTTTTYKGHKAAQRKIAAARKTLRSVA